MQQVTSFPYVVDKGKRIENKCLPGMLKWKKMSGITFKKYRKCLRIQKKMLKFG